jgi:hypothetical protein
MDGSDRPRRPWILGLVIVLITAGVAVALISSEESGTGASDVGDRADAVDRPADPPAGPDRAEARPARCQPTESNPGGTNNYIPDAPEADSLGSGFVIQGLVRTAEGCRPLADVRIQVWLATESGGEQDNRASTFTDSDGRYRLETDPTVPQFGEPNIHVGYDDGDYREVFIRRVVDLDDTRATIDLNLTRGG